MNERACGLCVFCFYLLDSIVLRMPLTSFLIQVEPRPIRLPNTHRDASSTMLHLCVLSQTHNN